MGSPATSPSRTPGVILHPGRPRSGGQGLLVGGDRSPLRAVDRAALGPCTFRMVSDGRTALALLAREVLDLVLVDLHLPDFRGLELVRRIQQVAPATPVIVVVGRPPALATAIQLADLGLAGFVTPPITRARLLPRITRALGGPDPPAGPDHGPARAVIDAALAQMRSPDGSPVSVAALAATLGVTPRQLRSMARRAYGASIKACLVRARLERVVARLRESGEPIKCIASALGFHDSAHLARDLRRLTGLTATRLRSASHRRVREWLR